MQLVIVLVSNQGQDVTIVSIQGTGLLAVVTNITGVLLNDVATS